MLPFAAVPTTTTRKPAMTALAGLVPCAEAGISTTSRWPSPRAWWYARITARPANSPCAPELGCSDTAAKPVISHSAASSSRAHLPIALGLARRRERMHARERRPGHREHLGGGVQLHGAGAERDHRGVEADVLALEAADVAHHLGLRAMRVEHRVRQVRRGAAQRRRQIRHRIRGRRQRARLLPRRRGEHLDDVAEVGGGDGLVERDADGGLAGAPEVEAASPRPRRESPSPGPRQS